MNFEMDLTNLVEIQELPGLGINFPRGRGDSRGLSKIQHPALHCYNLPSPMLDPLLTIACPKHRISKLYLGTVFVFLHV